MTLLFFLEWCLRGIYNQGKEFEIFMVPRGVTPKTHSQGGGQSILTIFMGVQSNIEGVGFG